MVPEFMSDTAEDHIVGKSDDKNVELISRIFAMTSYDDSGIIQWRVDLVGLT